MILSEINIYPIKSLSGISLNNAVVEKRGLQLDRRWMLIDEKQNFLTQRNFPKMATVSVEILENGLRVSLNNDELVIPLEPNTNETESVKIWSSRCRAQVYEESVRPYFLARLLIRFPLQRLRRLW
jgi:uncharacterized protein YcbX